MNTLAELLAKETEKLGGSTRVAETYKNHFDKGGFMPALSWGLSGLPKAVLESWRRMLLLSGLLATGQISVKDDGSACGMSGFTIFRAAMRFLSNAIADHEPSAYFTVGTTLNCVTGKGLLAGNGTTGQSYIIGKNGCEPLTIKSGQNPIKAARDAIEKACGHEGAKRIEEAAGEPEKEDSGIPDRVIDEWMDRTRTGWPYPASGPEKPEKPKEDDALAGLIDRWIPEPAKPERPKEDDGLIPPELMRQWIHGPTEPEKPFVGPPKPERKTKGAPIFDTAKAK